MEKSFPAMHGLPLPSWLHFPSSHLYFCLLSLLTPSVPNRKSLLLCSVVWSLGTVEGGGVQPGPLNLQAELTRLTAVVIHPS